MWSSGWLTVFDISPGDGGRCNCSNQTRYSDCVSQSKIENREIIYNNVSLDMEILLITPLIGDYKPFVVTYQLCCNPDL